MKEADKKWTFCTKIHMETFLFGFLSEIILIFEKSDNNLSLFIGKNSIRVQILVDLISKVAVHLKPM